MSGSIRYERPNATKADVDLENLPALLKELDNAAGVADDVESKLDILLAQLEEMENKLASGTQEQPEDDQLLVNR